MTLRRCSPRDNNRPQADWRWVLVVCQQKMVPTNFEQRPNDTPDCRVESDIRRERQMDGIAKAKGPRCEVRPKA